MELIEREQKIIDLLIHSEDFISAKMISRKLGISEKTVYRDIVHIEELSGTDENLIIRVPGKGYKINYSAFLANSIKHEDNSKKCGISPKERRQQLLTYLLSKTPNETSINQLAQKYYISNASIVNDLKRIEEDSLKKAGLKLIKNNKGTYIEGSEKNIRKLFVKIINHNFSEKNYDPTLDKKMDDENYAFLLKNFQKKEIEFVSRLLLTAEKDLGFSLENPYFINIYVHLLILIKRLKIENVKIEKISIGKEDRDERLYAAALKIVEKIENYLNLHLPEDEANYIYGHLVSSGRYNGNKKLEFSLDNQSSLTNQLVSELIEDVSTKTSINIEKNDYLRQYLLQHFKPMLKRQNYDIQIKNALLPSIKSEFPIMFENVKNSLTAVFERHLLAELSEDEIGYVVLYFQNAFETEKQRKNVLIVCSTGVGTSHLLKTRVSKAFPLWNIKDVISAKNVWKYASDTKLDLILTTINLEEKQVPVVLVSAIFNEMDIKHVMKKLYEKEGAWKNGHNNHFKKRTDQA